MFGHIPYHLRFVPYFNSISIKNCIPKTSNSKSLDLFNSNCILNKPISKKKDSNLVGIDFGPEAYHHFPCLTADYFLHIFWSCVEMFSYPHPNQSFLYEICLTAKLYSVTHHITWKILMEWYFMTSDFLKTYSGGNSWKQPNTEMQIHHHQRKLLHAHGRHSPKSYFNTIFFINSDQHAPFDALTPSNRFGHFMCLKYA